MNIYLYLWAGAAVGTLPQAIRRKPTAAAGIRLT